MEILKNTFLFRLYSESKLLLLVVIVLILGTLWFALKSHEEVPFLLYGMYSLKEESQDEYITYSIVVNGKETIYKEMNDTQRELVETSLSNAASLKTHPMTTSGFVIWLRSYVNDNQSMEIYKLTCLYSQEGQLLIRKRELIYPHD